VNIVVFLGPSLPLAEARSILPEAVYRPPAQQGDVLDALTNDDPGVIALIDGQFHPARPVWHKELLLCLERGTAVYGASGIGALRAAELEAYGMRGRGEVFGWLASGELTGDDEIAHAYRFENGGYVRLSEPMVNIRATCAAARAAGAVPAAICGDAIEEAKGLYYPDRTPEAVIGRLRERGAGQPDLERLAAFCRDSRVDVAAEDARQLLRELRRYTPAAPPFPPPVRVAATAALNTLYNRERRVDAGGTRVALGDIAEHVVLHHPDARAVNSAALNRALALVTAKLMHVEPSTPEVEREAVRWRARHGCLSEEEFARWLRRNHLSRDEFAELARESATCGALHRWLLYCHSQEGSARFVLDHLRWEGDYERWARSAAESARLAGAAAPEQVAGYAAAGPEALAGEHERWTGSPADADLAAWAQEAGFSSLADFTFALAKSKAVRLQLLRLLRGALHTAGASAGPQPPA
jgi:hypothetical protein